MRISVFDFYFALEAAMYRASFAERTQDCARRASLCHLCGEGVSRVSPLWTVVLSSSNAFQLYMVWE